MALIGAADAISGVPGYKPPRQGLGAAIGGGGGTVYHPPASYPGLSLPGMGGGGGGGPQTTTTIMSPNQVYASDILNDPGSIAAQGQFDATQSNYAAARADAIQRAVISGGGAPQLSGTLAGYSGDVTPQTLAQAAANPMSQKAQLDLQLNQANANLPYDLAAGGMGRSGANAIEQGNLQRQYQTASYQGQQNMLDAIYGAANTYAGNYNDAMTQLMNARASVANRLAQLAGYSQTITTDGGGGGGDTGDNSGYPSGYYPDVTIPDVVKNVISQISSQPVSANRTGATAQRGRGIISIH